ncbi:hypothetical protein A0H81_08983, partial [Grifola frondosa]
YWLRRTSGTRRAIRGRRGSLKDMPKMPLDIIFEISTHLEPRDLLHLARTNKDFRALFTSRASSEALWKAARRNVDGLPDCPPFLSELEYANLMFSSHCHFCLKNGCARIICRVYVRCCSSCMNTEFTSSDVILPSTSLTVQQFRDYLVPSHVRYSHHVCQGLAEKVAQALRDVPAEKSVKFLEKQKLLANGSEWHAALLEDWILAKRASRAEELKAMKRQRYEAIIARLRKDGWGPELDFMKEFNETWEFSRLDAFRQTAKLTDKTWPKVEEGLRPHLEGIRERVLYHEREKVLKPRFGQFKDLISDFYGSVAHNKKFMPHLIDFLMMPEFKALGDAPNARIITTEDIGGSQGGAGFVLLKYITPHEDVELFDLATAVFSCKRRGHFDSLHRYPDILADGCLHELFYEGRSYITEYSYKATQTAGERLWDCNAIKVGTKRTIRHARKVIRCCGLDPDHTLREQMDALDVKLKCTTCESLRPHISLMTWDNAVAHLDVYDCGPKSLRLVTDGGSTTVEKLEDSRP